MIETNISATRKPMAKPRWNAAFDLCVRLQKNSAHQFGIGEGYAVRLEKALSASPNLRPMNNTTNDGWTD